MKKNLFSILLLCLAGSAGAQSETRITVGAGLGPLITMAFNSSSSNAPLPSYPARTYSQYVDSIRSHETWRLAFQFNICMNYFINKNLDLQTGLGYIDVGYQREQKDLKYNNPTYPGIGAGKIEELSSNRKDIFYNYRFQYLQLPLLMNYRFKRTRDLLFTFAFSGGIAANFLLKHQMNAVLGDGFTINGARDFKIDSSGYKASPFTVNLLLGGRMEYKYEKRLHLVFQPLIGFYPISVTSGAINCFPLYFSANFGINYELK